MPQPLSTKENNLFKQVVKEYELKNYKKGSYFTFSLEIPTC